MSPCDMLHEPLGGLRNGGPIFSVPWVQQADLNQHLDKIDLVDLDAEPDAACACARRWRCLAAAFVAPARSR
jgi:hypothetical protein